MTINKSDFTESDKICYELAIYDLSQLKLKKPKAYTNAIAKLIPNNNTPSDNDIIEAIFTTYGDKTFGSIYRKFERLSAQGLLK